MSRHPHRFSLSHITLVVQQIHTLLAQQTNIHFPSAFSTSQRQSKITDPSHIDHHHVPQTPHNLDITASLPPRPSHHVRRRLRLPRNSCNGEELYSYTPADNTCIDVSGIEPAESIVVSSFGANEDVTFFSDTTCDFESAQVGGAVSEECFLVPTTQSVLSFMVLRSVGREEWEVLGYMDYGYGLLEGCVWG